MRWSGVTCGRRASMCSRPSRRSGARILTAPNVTTSPHHAGTSDVSNLEMSQVATACVLTILGGGSPPSLINPDALANARS